MKSENERRNNVSEHTCYSGRPMSTSWWNFFTELKYDLRNSSSKIGVLKVYRQKSQKHSNIPISSQNENQTTKSLLKQKHPPFKMKTFNKNKTNDNSQNHKNQSFPIIE